MPNPATTLSLTALLATATICGQRPTLVADFNTTRVPDQGSQPSGMARLGSEVFVNLFTRRTGFELYRTTGAPGAPTLVADLVPGAANSFPTRLTPFGNTMLFAANVTELWRSDGTRIGTQRVWSFPRGQTPHSFTVIGSTAVFLVGTSRTYEVWRTDGTPGGTRRIAPAVAGIGGMVGGAGIAYFIGEQPTTGRELWKTDGTPAGTSIVRDLLPGTAGSRPQSLAVLGQRVVFVANGPSGRAHYVSDGTAAGTRLLVDTDGSREPPIRTKPVVFGGRLFFGAHGVQPATGGLWVTDGTVAGTARVADTSGEPTELTVAGRQLFFTVSRTSLLWRSDGTALGTRVIVGAPTLTKALGVIGPRLVFEGFDSNGAEPWVTDGVTTQLLRDIAPGPQSSRIATSAATGTGLVVFNADDGVRGEELWVTDGTPANTQILWNYRPGPAHTESSNAIARTDLGAQVACYVPTTRSTGTLFITDGSQAGTRRLASVAAGISDDTLDGSIYSADSSGLYRVDPNTGRQWRLHPSRPNVATRLGRFMYFFVEGNRKSLWRTDGTATGTVLVWRAGSALPGLEAMRRIGNQIYAVVGGRLLRTDGTNAGTVLYPPIGNSDAFDFVAYRGGLIVSTSAGAYRVTNPNVPAVALPMPPWRGRPVVLGGVLYSLSLGFVSDLVLSRTDGTVAGTSQVRTFTGPETPYGLDLVVHRDHLYFYATDPQRGVELWRSDGTTAGTSIVRELVPGPQGVRAGGLAEMVSGDRYLWFRADDRVHGMELWRTDGTSAGTTLVYDLNPGPASSNTLYLVRRQGELWFTATDGVVGAEIWRIEIGAHSHSVGSGCAASNSPPVLRSSTPRLGTPITIDLSGAAPSARSGVLALGAAIARQTNLGFGCDLFVDFAGPYQLFPFQPRNGSQRWTATLPNLPALQGVRLPLQAAIGTPSNPPLGLDLSNGLYLVLQR